MTDLCPFCGSARITYPCINGQPGDECKCGECGRSWPFKFIEVNEEVMWQSHAGRKRVKLAEEQEQQSNVHGVEAARNTAIRQSAERSTNSSSAAKENSSTFVPQGASQGVSSYQAISPSRTHGVCVANGAAESIANTADSQGLPSAGDSSLTQYMGMNADRQGGAVDCPVPIDEMAKNQTMAPLQGSAELLTFSPCASIATLFPIADDMSSQASCGADAAPGGSADVGFGAVAQGKTREQTSIVEQEPSKLRVAGSNPVSPSRFAGERGSVERQPTMARGAHSPDSPAIQDSYTGQLIDELTCAVMRAEERAVNRG